MANDNSTWNRWGAGAGYVAVALGLVAASFERGSPKATAPAEQLLAFFLKYRVELLTQSLFFVLSAAVMLWFLGCLRGFLRRFEPGGGTLSGAALGAGTVWVTLQMVMQAVQVATAMAAGPDLSPALAKVLGDLAYALSVFAYAPLGIMLAAVAVVALKYHAMPAWLGWLSVVAAAANLLMSVGIVADAGPLVPGGLLMYALYLLTAVWQVAVPTLMLMRAGREA